MPDSSILVVEDNPNNLRLVLYLLQAAGFTVHAAASGQAAIEDAQNLSPDLILMDIELPGMDGLEATRRLKADPVTAHIPVVAVTANAMEGDREHCIDAGCAGYITKPLDTIHFADHIRTFLGPHAS